MEEKTVTVAVSISNNVVEIKIFQGIPCTGSIINLLVVKVFAVAITGDCICECSYFLLIIKTNQIFKGFHNKRNTPISLEGV